MSWIWLKNSIWSAVLQRKIVKMLIFYFQFWLSDQNAQSIFSLLLPPDADLPESPPVELTFFLLWGISSSVSKTRRKQMPKIGEQIMKITNTYRHHFGTMPRPTVLKTSFSKTRSIVYATCTIKPSVSFLNFSMPSSLLGMSLMCSSSASKWPPFAKSTKACNYLYFLNV